MKKPRHPSALALVAGALASILQPPYVTSPSAWAQKHLVVADGPRAGSRWDPSLTPLLVPVLDALAPATVLTIEAPRAADVGRSARERAGLAHDATRAFLARRTAHRFAPA